MKLTSGGISSEKKGDEGTGPEGFSRSRYFFYNSSAEASESETARGPSFSIDSNAKS